MKILVVDDHSLIREALHGVLKKLTRDAVVLEAANYAQTMEVIASNPDISLILLDLTLPDRDGFSMLAELRERNPAVSVVVLSAVQDRANVMKALELGAMGYIPKSARNEVMLSALQLVFAGGIYIPPEILGREHLSQTLPRPSERVRAIVSPADLGLTERQLDVLALMMQGKNNKSICRMLNLAEPTVKNHVTAILKALKVTNRTEAVIAVNELGWKLPATPQL
jgi:DNA-binding NarL/FixJ family response regulator